MKMRVLLALGMTGAACVLAAPASATVVAQHDTAVVAGPRAYPIQIQSTLSVSTQNPVFNETITVTGLKYKPNASVSLDMVKQSGAAGFVASAHTVAAKSYSLGAVTSDANGSFSLKVTMPGAGAGAGTYLVRGYTNYNGPNIPSQNVFLTAGGGTGATTTGSTNTGSGTAFTGLDIAGLVLLALVLLGVGGVLAARGRKRVNV